MMTEGASALDKDGHLSAQWLERVTDEIGLTKREWREEFADTLRHMAKLNREGRLMHIAFVAR